MSTDEGKTRSFPMLPTTAWWQLRSRFQRSLPAKVDPQYVETVLGVSAKSARNTTPALRTLGLIDDDGRPTPLANDWRTDEGYANACEQMLADVYPPALRDAVPPDEPDRAAAERWFIRERRVGQGAARQMAALYALVAERDASGAENQRAPRSDRGGGERRPRETRNAESTRRTTTRERLTSRPPSPAEPPAGDSQRSASPSLHIDVQVHVPSDATPEQIEAIFSSMAKHLYKQS
jgi:hypothetical protein